MLETFISSRLTAAGRWTSSDGRAVAEIAMTEVADDRGAPTYEWTLRLDGATLGRAEDLSGWDNTFKDLLHMLADFMSAWQEAQRYPNSDNRDIFPASCEPWLDYADEFYSDTMTEEDE